MRVCLYPQVGSGGPGSFQSRLGRALQASGVEITHRIEDRPLHAVLIFAASRNWRALEACRRERIPVVQRLDGINWIHRAHRVPAAYFVTSEIRNWLLRVVRARYADRIVYQSAFVRDWWHRWFGVSRRPHTVIHNGVEPAPARDRTRPQERVMIVVEGAVRLDRASRAILGAAHKELRASNVIQRTMVFGHVPSFFHAEDLQIESLEFRGHVAIEEIAHWQSRALVQLSLELNPPCPNSVIEALNAGLPVLGYDTGSLRELVHPGEGEVLPYSGDVWKLEPPAHLESLRPAGTRIAEAWADYSHAARVAARERFDIARIASRYREALGV